MADQIAHRNSFPIKLVDNGDGTYSESTALSNGSIDLINSISNAVIGAYGGEYITTTATNNATSGFAFFALQAITDTVVNTVTGNININSASLPAQTIVYGEWSAISLTSGNAIAYKKVV